MCYKEATGDPAKSCYQCPDRHPICRSECQYYLERTKRYQQDWEEREKKYVLQDYVADSMYRRLKSMHKKDFHK